MRVKRPELVTFIGYINLFSVFLLILSFFQRPKFTEKFGVYFTPTPDFLEGIIKILMIICLSIICYGFLKLKTWGYWLMVAYYLFFLVVSMIFLLKQNGHSYNTPGYITSLLALMIIFPSKRYYIKENGTL